jgi:hypothetical protein
MHRLMLIRNAHVVFLTQDILQPQAFHLPAFEQGHAVVPAELKGSCWGELRRSGAFYNLYESYETALRGRYIQNAGKDLVQSALEAANGWRTGLWDPVRRASQSVKFLSSLPRNMEALGQEIKLGIAPKRSMSRYRELKYFQSTRGRGFKRYQGLKGSIHPPISPFA